LASKSPNARPGEGDCPVAALATEAAAVRRLMRRLRERSPHADPDLIARLEAGDDTVSIDELRDACFERLAAITEVASHRRARSAKGAVFQLYVMADRLTGLDDVLTLDAMTKRDKDKFEEWRTEVRRLAYSAATQIEETADDDDLHVLRDWMLSPQYDVLAKFDGLLNDSLRTSP
jgi:hypothetical protein